MPTEIVRQNVINRANEFSQRMHVQHGNGYIAEAHLELCNTYDVMPMNNKIIHAHRTYIQALETYE